MPYFLFVGLLLLSSSAVAESCSVIGNSVFCSNGLSGNRVGDTMFWNDGVTSNRIGNSTFNSDGTSSQRIGGSTFYSDGTSSNRIGNSTLIEGGRGLLVHVTLKNFGQTPGYDVTSWIKPPVIRPADAVPFGPAPPVAKRGGRSMIGPQANASLFWTIPVSDAQLMEIKAGDLKVFVWGGVDYTDVLGNDRHFIFRTTNGSAVFINKPGDQTTLVPHAVGYSAN